MTAHELNGTSVALANAGHESAWREWLRLSNLREFNPVGLTIGSVLSTLDLVSSVEDEAIKQGLILRTPVRERNVVVEIFEGGKKGLILVLAKADLRIFTELGFEVEGEPISTAWSDH